ncbi:MULTISPECIES: hypothetical protein [Citrobacter]|nr:MULTISPECIES: hypothetical protein [Citrobacter]MBJ8810102.1 hypothetical protein [Citrobacter koseri]MBJ9345229.1 hypothetical protein [Citrobacter koseri]MBJ9353036.1 hypothetical protein [Citrobacter koseri]MDM2966405.1 hypothetical protein [Citrobacter sp. CK201]MDM3039860.1 hypothetical protein [Citrobacter sp. CK181]
MIHWNILKIVTNVGRIRRQPPSGNWQLAMPDGNADASYQAYKAYPAWKN